MEADAARAADDQQPVIKKGRGRPRKDGLPAGSSKAVPVDGEEEAEKGDDLNPLLRSAGDDDVSLVQKRKPGRPKGSMTIVVQRAEEQEPFQVRRSARLPPHVTPPPKPLRRSEIRRELRNYDDPDVEPEPEKEVNPFSPINSRVLYEKWVRDMEEQAAVIEEGQPKALRSMADKLLLLAKAKEAARDKERRLARERQARAISEVQKEKRRVELEQREELFKKRREERIKEREERLSLPKLERVIKRRKSRKEIKEESPTISTAAASEGFEIKQEYYDDGVPEDYDGYDDCDVKMEEMPELEQMDAPDSPHLPAGGSGEEVPEWMRVTEFKVEGNLDDGEVEEPKPVAPPIRPIQHLADSFPDL